jgi:hypothetical protein
MGIIHKEGLKFCYENSKVLRCDDFLWQNFNTLWFFFKNYFLKKHISQCKIVFFPLFFSTTCTFPRKLLIRGGGCPSVRLKLWPLSLILLMKCKSAARNRTFCVSFVLTVVINLKLSVNHAALCDASALCTLQSTYPDCRILFSRWRRRWPAIDLVAASRLTHAHYLAWRSGDASSAAIIIMSLQPASAARRACVAAIATTTIDEGGANVKGPSMLLFSGKGFLFFASGFLRMETLLCLFPRNVYSLVALEPAVHKFACFIVLRSCQFRWDGL